MNASELRAVKCSCGHDAETHGWDAEWQKFHCLARDCGCSVVDWAAVLAAAWPPADVRGYTLEHFDDDGAHLGPCVLVADLERIAIKVGDRR